MEKYYRRFLGIAVALVVILSIVGCGETKDNTSSTVASESKSEQESETVGVVSPWILDYDEDQFGDKTTKAYLGGVFSGAYSYSSRSGDATVLVTFPSKGYFGINLRTGGVNLSIPSNPYILKFSIKDEKGNVTEYEKGLKVSQGLLIVENQNIIAELRKPAKIKCSIHTMYLDYSQFNCHFEMDTNGLEELYTQLGVY